MELTPLQPIQIMSTVLAVLILIVTMYWAHIRVREDFAYMIGPVMYCIHLIIFYSALIFRDLGMMAFGPVTIWSAWLRFQGLATMLGVLLLIANNRRKNMR